MYACNFYSTIQSCMWNTIENKTDYLFPRPMGLGPTWDYKKQPTLGLGPTWDHKNNPRWDWDQPGTTKSNPLWDWDQPETTKKHLRVPDIRDSLCDL